MKIAIIGPAYPYRGGIANFSERLAAEFVSSNDEVHLYTFSMMYPNFIFPGKTQFSDTALQYDLKIFREINSINPFNWIRVGRHIKKANYDLVLFAYSIPFLSPSLGSIARIIKSNKSTKIVSIIHNLHPHEKRVGDNILSTYFLNSCYAHLALSDKVNQDILELMPNAKTIYSPHPIYDTFGKIIDKAEAKLQLNLSNNTNYILFFGLIRKYKGLDILINAMSIVKEKLPNTKLIIAGEFYEDIEKYMAQVEGLGLRDEILMYNQFIPEDKVNLYFCAADIVVQPYKNATQSGITQICYHFNKPMIVTNVGGLAENVPNDIVGFVCLPNTKEIASSIINFYNLDKEDTFINNIKIEKKKYSWEKLVEKIKSII
jgi:D-inositol-3-phosphate glycosyltransferase